MGFKIKDAKILWYSTKHTHKLIEKMLDKYHDDSLSDSSKKRKIARYATAIAIRNIKRARFKAVGLAAKKKTFVLVDKIESIYNDETLTYKEKKKKISKLCFAIAVRRGFINVKDEVLAGGAVGLAAKIL